MSNCDASADEVIEMLNGPVDGLEIPLCDAVHDGKIVTLMHVRLSSMSAAKYRYSYKDSKYIYMEDVELQTITSGRVIDPRD